MSTNRPNFARGLFGSANRIVCNRWSEATELVMRNAQGMALSQGMVVPSEIVELGLVTISSATALAANRWTYTVAQWFPPPLTGTGVTVPNNQRMTYTEAINLREWHNTATIVDGMDITAPASTIGPVGSKWNGSAWPTSSLEAKVMLYVVRNTAGAAQPVFDRPNPIRCSSG
jgi:hypothetical protein